MEKLFKTYHGEKHLKAGKASVATLAGDIANLISLPKDVISFYVKCRIFFRIRILNQNMVKERRDKRKMNKLQN